MGRPPKAFVFAVSSSSSRRRTTVVTPGTTCATRSCRRSPSRSNWRDIRRRRYRVYPSDPLRLRTIFGAIASSTRLESTLQRRSGRRDLTGVRTNSSLPDERTLGCSGRYRSELCRASRADFLAQRHTSVSVVPGGRRCVRSKSVSRRSACSAPFSGVTPRCL